MTCGPPYRAGSPPVAKSELYRGEIADAALEAVLLAVERFAGGAYVPREQDAACTADARLRPRPYLDQSVRRIDWAEDSTECVLRKLRAADSQPGVLDVLLGGEWYLHGGHPESGLRGRPGELLATPGRAICRATGTAPCGSPNCGPGAGPGSRPLNCLPCGPWATGCRRCPSAPCLCCPSRGTVPGRTSATGRTEDVGFLSFSFPGGAMSTEQCRRLLDAYREACARPTWCWCWAGGTSSPTGSISMSSRRDDPAAESWANIEAIDDLVERS